MRKITLLITIALSATLFFFITNYSKEGNLKFDESIELYYQNSKTSCKNNINTCQNYEIAKLAINGKLEEANKARKALLASKLIDPDQCHAISHFLGEVSYYKNGLTETLNSKEQGCLQGIYHGAIFQYVKNLKTKIDESKIRDICTLANSKHQDQQICIHGIGHAFIYNKDIKHGVESCARVFDQRSLGNKKLDKYFSCLGGVFASELTKNPKHLNMSIAINSLEPYLETCKKFEKETKKVCISLYATEGLGRSEINPELQLGKCLKILHNEIDCAYGLGISFANYYDIDIKELISYCQIQLKQKDELLSKPTTEKITSACLEGYQSAIFLKKK
jgi:hypothetical protein